MATTILVTLASYVISYVALVGLAELAGIDQPLPLIFPLTIDGLLTTGLVAAIALRSARARARFYIWTLIGAATLVSVAGNAAHSVAHTLGDPLIVRGLLAGVSAVPAGTLAASLHLVVLVWRHAERPVEPAPVVAPVPLVEAAPEPVHEPLAEPVPAALASPPVERRSRRRRERATIAEAESYLTAQEAAGRDPLSVPAAEVGRALKVSRPTAQRWVRELRSSFQPTAGVAA